MTATFQTFAALVVVAIAAGALVYSMVRKRGTSGCGGGGCPAVSPEVKKLQARLKR